MSKRKPISVTQNNWVDSQSVDDKDLTLEQDYNSQIQSGLINNHIGTGVLPENLNQIILFDSTLITGLLDGKALDPQNDPIDTTFGSQLELELSDSEAFGKRSVKVAIIGLDFENNLQYDTFYFRKNEIQITSKHYIKILKVLVNDLIGSSNQSFNLGGKLVIREAKSLSLSRDTIMISQDSQPNIFWRDFFITGASTLNSLLQTALPLYNVDNLGITTGYKQLRNLNKSDVASHIGQKFIAKTNNIQKITLLLAATNATGDPPLSTNPWTGDLVISIYPLQSNIECLSDIAPNLAIDFDPSNIPLAQISVTYTSLLSNGIDLDSVPQPVDFVFSNTTVAGGSIIKEGSYYAVTLRRSGSADSGIIQVAVGNDNTEDSTLTLFNGDSWTDVPEEDLWFQVWTDAAKITDGQAYDNGNGIIIPKTKLNSTSGAEEDHSLEKINFVRNESYYAFIQANTEKNTPIQDERTGNPVFSRKQFVPEVSLITSSKLAELKTTFDPLLAGVISDKNKKSVDSAASSTLSFGLYSFSLTGNELLIKIIDDITDIRYDANVLGLVSKFLDGSLNNAKFTPNTNKLSLVYRVASSELINMKYGDINGDGIVDEQDLILMQDFEGYNLNIAPATSAEYLAVTQIFVDDSSLIFQVKDSVGTILLSGTDGILTVNPFDSTICNFSSAAEDFSTVSDISSKFIHITSTNSGNNGAFSITGMVDINNISVKKKYYSSDNLLKLFRADITCNGEISSGDTSLISQYVYKEAPFPITSSPGNRIGTSFNILRIKLELLNDRTDNYTTSISLRNQSLHAVQDIFLNDQGVGGTGFAGLNLSTSPITSSFLSILSWDADAISVASNIKLVPSIFTTNEGLVINPEELVGVDKTYFPDVNIFDPGKNDQFLPNNLILGFGGEIKRPDGYYYKVDFEVGNVTLEIPANVSAEEKSINIFTDFIADYSGTGLTRLGFEAMRFADSSFADMFALQNQQIRFNVAVQSFSPNLDGYIDALEGRMGIYMNHTSGMLTINFSELYEDSVLQTLSTKIQIIVYLKKSRFNNSNLFVDSEKLKNLLGIT